MVIDQPVQLACSHSSTLTAVFSVRADRILSFQLSPTSGTGCGC